MRMRVVELKTVEFAAIETGTSLMLATEMLRRKVRMRMRVVWIGFDGRCNLAGRTKMTIVRWKVGMRVTTGIVHATMVFDFFVRMIEIAG